MKIKGVDVTKLTKKQQQSMKRFKFFKSTR